MDKPEQVCFWLFLWTGHVSQWRNVEQQIRSTGRERCDSEAVLSRHLDALSNFQQSELFSLIVA
jgi:hypothetical protein